MFKKLVALTLSLAIINTNGMAIYAEEIIEEQNETNQEITKEIISNIHSVYSTQELQDAINNSQNGDVIRVYPGEYLGGTITVSKSNISIEGYTSDDIPVSNNTDAISTNAQFDIKSDDVTLKGIETKNINIGGYNLITNNTKVIDCSILGFTQVGYFLDEGINTNILIDGCYSSSIIKVNSSNNIIKNTKATSIDIESSDNLVDNCDLTFLDIGSTKKVVKNVKAQDTKISRFLEIGANSKMASDILIERVTSSYTDIGYKSGIATNVIITDSDLKECNIGVWERGKSNNISIKNSIISTLDIGTAGGSAKNTRLVDSNISGKISIGDTETGSSAVDTFIETNNSYIVGMGTNTVVFKNILNGINKLQGKASSGLRIEVIKDDTTLINTTIEENQIIDKYFKNDDPNYSLVSGDRIKLNIYDSNNLQIFSEEIVIQDSIVSLPKPVVISQISNTSTEIRGTAKSGNRVYILKENQRESDNDILTTIADQYGKFYIKVNGLKEEETFSIYSRDNGRNISEVLEIAVLDRTAPEFTINPYKVGDKNITGVSEPGSIISAIRHREDLNVGSNIGQSIANEDGIFFIPVELETKHNDIIRVNVSDKSGNSIEEFITVIDNSIPEFINIDPINDKSNTIKGTVSEANISVKAVYLGDTEQNIGTTTSDEEGNFEIMIPFTIKGSHSIKFIASDSANNKSEQVVNIKETISVTDVEGHWASKEIYDFIDKGYVNGYSNGTFKPNNSITRAEFVTIFNKAFELKTKSGKVFSDTNAHWAKEEIDIAVSNGVCNGKSATEFKPNDPITREEAAVMVSNYKKLADKNHDKLNNYNDKIQVSTWAKDSVEGIIENGYMGGYSDGTFRPKGKITRAEAVVTLSRLIQ